MPLPYEQDPWADHRYDPVRPPFATHNTGRGRDRLFAGEWRGEGLHRSRSQGHQPLPNVHIYNVMDQEANPNVAQEQPRGRTAHLGADLLDDELHFRARSRGRSDAGWRDHSPAMWDRQYHELREAEMRMKLDKEKDEEIYRQKMDLKYMQDKLTRDEEDARLDRRRKEWELREIQKDRERAAEEERIRREYELRKHREEQEEEKIRQQFETRRLKEEAKRKREAEEAEQERRRAVEHYLREKEQREREAKEAQRRALEEHERKEAEAKAEEKRMIARIKQKEIEREEEEKRQWEEFLAKQEKKKKEEEEKKKKKEAEIHEEMRKRLAEVGFQQNQIDVMIDPKHRESKALVPGSLPNNPLQVHTPTFVKVHKDHLSIETLRYFNIPWEWDRTDKNFIIILRELDQRQTDELFEHTRSVRTRTMTHLLVEQKPHRDNQYMWVRHKQRRPSVSPKPKSPKRVGLREILF